MTLKVITATGTVCCSASSLATAEFFRCLLLTWYSRLWMCGLGRNSALGRSSNAHCWPTNSCVSILWFC